MGKTYSQQKKGMWTKKQNRKKTQSIFHDLELETWGNRISSKKKKKKKEKKKRFELSMIRTMGKDSRIQQIGLALEKQDQLKSKL